MKNLTKWNKAIYLLKTQLWYAPKFHKIGSRTIIFDPLQMDNTRTIEIGNNTFIAHKSWLMGSMEKNEPTLKIGDGVRIGHFAHIVALKSVTIENDVLLADKVYIADSGHSFEDVLKPVLYQPAKILREVRIGEGSWIGENVCIYGASVGKHSVIGANSVVTKDIPAFCVAVGCPAKVIKRYDFEKKEWIKV